MRRDRFDFLEIAEAPHAPAEEELLLPSVDDLPPQGATPTVRHHATGGRLALLETIGEAGQEIGRFSSPSGLCVDGADNLYVADTMRHRIQKITPQDEAYGYGGVGEGAGQFRMPSDVVVDPRSFIYVLEMGNHRITKLTQDGTYMCSIGGRGDGFGRFRSPEAVCMDRFNTCWWLIRGTIWSRCSMRAGGSWSSTPSSASAGSALLAVSGPGPMARSSWPTRGTAAWFTPTAPAR